MANNLRILRDSRGWSQDQAAAALGTTRNQYAKLEAGSRRLSDKWIDRAAEGFGIDHGEVVTNKEREVPLEGLVGAGSALYPQSEGGPIEYVPAPSWANDETKALEIRGISLGPSFDGWLIFYDDVRVPVTDDLIGSMCVCGLADGRVMVKTLRKGQLKRRFTLESNTEQPLYDAEVLWAARVKEMRPR